MDRYAQGRTELGEADRESVNVIHDLNLAFAEQLDEKETSKVEQTIEAESERLPGEIWIIVAIVLGTYANAIWHLMS